MMVVVAITRLHIMMVVMRGTFADYITIVVCIDLAVVMIVMDDIGIMITVDARYAIVVLVMFSARRRAGQNKSSDCQSTKDCLLHERLGG